MARGLNYSDVRREKTRLMALLVLDNMAHGLNYSYGLTWLMALQVADWWLMALNCRHRTTDDN